MTINNFILIVAQYLNSQIVGFFIIEYIFKRLSIMKVKNKIFVFALILSLIFTVSCVAAEDMTFEQSELEMVSDETEIELNQEENMVEDDSQDTLSSQQNGGGKTQLLNNEELLSNDGNSTKGTFSDLYDYIQANKGYQKTVYLNKDYEFNETTDSWDYGQNGIYIGTFTSIDGQGHTIDAKGSRIIFNTIGKNIVLKNITFLNSAYRAIEVGSSDVSIIDCLFLNNSYRALVVTDSGVNCIIDNSQFINGSGVYTAATGTLITNSKFLNNSNSDGGALEVRSDNVVVDNCEFINNTATDMIGKGGAIYYRYELNNGSLTVKNSNFRGNGANSGGAIYNYINDRSEQNNILKVFSNNVDIDTCTFEENIANNAPDVHGTHTRNKMLSDGGKYWDDFAELFKDLKEYGTITLTKDYVITHGPIITEVSNFSIKGNNHQIDANGNQVFQFYDTPNGMGEIKIYDVTIKNARSSFRGGAIYFFSYGTVLFVNNSHFINCSTNAPLGGGVIFSHYYPTAVTLYVYNSSFDSNSAYSGGVYRSGGAGAKFYYCNFTNNIATTGGVACYLMDNLFFEYCTFINNTANRRGVLDGNSMSQTNNVKYSYFENNTAYSNVIGMNILDQSSNTFVNNNLKSKFSEYFEDTTSGVVVLPREYFDFEGTITLTDNLMIEGNGSIINAHGSTVFMVHSNNVVSFKNFTLINGTIRSSYYQSMIVENVTFINCTVALNFVDAGSTYSKVNNVNFINCTIPIYNNGDTSRELGLNITNIKIDGKSYSDKLFSYLHEVGLGKNNNKLITLPKDNYDSITTFWVRGINITIDGNGSTINSLYGATIFKVGGVNITIKNFILKDTNRDAIFFYTSQPTYDQVVNITFINCSRAIYFQKYPYISEGVIVNQVVHNSTFVNCSKNNGGALYFEFDGVVKNCKFENTLAAVNGGAIFFKEHGVVDNCSFNNVRAGSYGGAVYFNMNGTVVDSNFTNIRALNGGAIYSDSSDSLNITNCEFNDNTAYSSGGAVFSECDAAISGSDFTRNSADVGGAVFAHNHLTVDDCTFDDNEATLGGAIDSNGDSVIIKNSDFTDNDADVGAGISIAGDNAILENLTFKNNHADHGGAIYSTGDHNHINNITAANNEAVNGAAILIEGDHAVISDSKILNNTNTNGSSISITGKNATIGNVDIIDNNGNGINVTGNENTLEDITISNNNGTGIIANGDDNTIQDIQITGNNGTGLDVTGKDNTLDNVTITGGTGIGIDVTGNNTEITDVIITNHNGTAVDVDGNDNTIQNATIRGNNGTAVDVDGNNNTVRDVEIIDNIGTGLDITGEDNKLDNITITGGTGTGVDVDGNNTKINDVEITNHNGTAVDVDGNDNNITDVTIRGNNGTAVDVDGNNNTVRDIEIIDNIGTGLDITGEDNKLDNITITGGTGTGVDVDGNNTKINDVEITNHNGTGIDATGNNNTITNATITDNNGTGLNVTGEDNKLDNITISGGTGTGVDVTGNNTNINDVEITNHTGTGVDVDGNDNNIGNVDITGNNGTGVDVNGNDNKIHDINITDNNGTALNITGEGNELDNININGGNGTGIDVAGNNTKINDVDIENHNGTGINITGNNNTMTDLNITGNNGTAVDVNGNNNTIRDADIIDNNGTGVDVTGEGNELDNINIKGGDGADIIINGNNTTVTNVNVTDRKGDGIIVNGTGNKISNVDGAKATPILNIQITVNGFNVIVTVRTSAEGYVYFVLNGKEYRQNIVNGVAVFNLVNVAPNTYTIPMYFAGSGIWNNTQDVLNFTVFKQNAVILASSATYSVVYGGTYTVKTNAFNQMVSFKINGKTYNVQSDANGVAKIKLTKAMLKTSGKKTIAVTLSSNYFNANSASAKITVKKEKTKFTAKKSYKFKNSKKTKKIKVTLKDSKKKAVKKVKVTLKIKGKKVKGKKTFNVKTNKKGVVTFKITSKKTKFAKGKYTATLSFKGNKYYNKVTKKIQIVIK